MNKRLKKKLGVETVKVAKILPGDVVVIKCNKVLSDDDKAFTCKQLAGLFPKNRILVVDAICDLEIKRNESNV